LAVIGEDEVLFTSIGDVVGGVLYCFFDNVSAILDVFVSEIALLKLFIRLGLKLFILDVNMIHE